MLIRFITLILSVITLSALMAHVIELPAKMSLSKQDYQTAQAIYRGWALLGISEIGTIIFMLIWMVQERKEKQVFALLMTATLLLMTSMAVFFLFTYPVNKQTVNWTQLPDHWQALRRTWEYSHLVHAALNFVSFCLLLIVLLKSRYIRNL